MVWLGLTSVTSDSLVKRKSLRQREIGHGTLAWALDEFLVIKVGDPTLAILASMLNGEISSCLAQISNNPYERKPKPNPKSIEL